jgi:hypothetical protein
LYCSFTNFPFLFIDKLKLHEEENQMKNDANKRKSRVDLRRDGLGFGDETIGTKQREEGFYGQMSIDE